MNIRLRRAVLRLKLRALLALHSLLRRLLARRQSPAATCRRPPYAPPEMTFVIEDGIEYTPERRAAVAACMREAADDFQAYAVGRFVRDRTIERDWPTSINVRVERDRVEWSLTSHSGHRFTASYPERRGPSC
jgi:hypothetical protein